MDKSDQNKAYAGEASEEAEPRRLWLAVAGAIALAVSLTLRWLKVGYAFEHVLAGGALLIAAVPVVREAARRFREHPFNTEVLMVSVAAGASAIGLYEEGAAVLVLYNFAEAIEDYTVEKVKGIARRMASLLPQRALVKRNGTLVEVPVERLRVGETIVVKPGWRIPIDGRVVAGSSSVDQSAVTGESLPVEKNYGDTVLSGTLNLEGSLEVEAEKAFRDSTISRVIGLVVEAQERKARIERFIDRFSKFYAPAMLALAASIAMVPPFALGQPLDVWVYRALVVLVISCPSALVISTPVTMLMGLTRAMWSSILVKGGIYLEELSKVKVVAFDKTGTLTEGRLRVVKVVPAEGFKEEEVLLFAARAEAGSSHPIAAAIFDAANKSGVDPSGCCQVTELGGKGVKACLEEGRVILVGKPSFLSEEGVRLSTTAGLPTDSDFETRVAVAVDGKFAGSIAMADEVRSEAKQAVSLLRFQGMKVVMLTGDNEATARQVAKDLGIEEYHAALFPEDKVRIGRSLRRRYGAVVMVGDGVNDAPVLAAANVGVAIGTAGNDIAIDVADVALMGSDLRMVPYLLKLGRKVAARLKINVGIALLLKSVLIILGALGFIPLWIGVLGDDGVTLIVIAFALPLLGYKG